MIPLRVYKLGKRYRLTGNPSLVPVPRLRSSREVEDLVWVLRHVTFKTREGEVMGVIGPSGSGKTTLLQIIGGVTSPSAGRAEYQGRVVPLLALRATQQRDMSGLENVRLAAALHGIPRKLLDDTIWSIFDRAGVTTHAETPLSRYSSGMLTRLSFWTAMAFRPRIVLADDPFPGGSTLGRHILDELKQQAAEAQFTVLFVSNDLHEVRRMCDRALWLQDGAVRELGRAGPVADSYQRELEAPSDPDSMLVRKASKWGSLKRIALVHDESAPHALTTRPLTVAITLRLNAPGSEFSIVLAIHSPGRGTAYTAASPSVVVEQAGEHVIGATIPANLLTAASYEVIPLVSITHRGITRTLPSRVVTVTLVDEPGTEAREPEFVTRSVLRPALKWDYGRLPSPASRGSEA